MKPNHYLQHIIRWTVSVYAVWLFSLSASGINLPQYSFRNWETTEGLPHNSIYTVVQARDGHIWFGTYHGVGCFDGSRFTTLTATNLPHLKDEMVRALCETRDGSLWIGTEEAGLYRMKDGVVTQMEGLPPERRMRCFLETKDGTLWIGTASGLGRFKDGKMTWITKKDGLPDSIVICLCEDTDGSLWIGTNHGLARYLNGFQEIYKTQDGLPMESIRALCMDNDRALWAGLGGNGVARLKDKQFQVFDKAEGISDSFVSAFFKDSRGQFWVGTLSGLCRFVDGRFIDEKNADGTHFETIFCIMEDREGNIWVGTKEGLGQLKTKTFVTYTKSDGIAHNNVMSVFQDREERMWIGTWGGGLTLFEGTNSQFYRGTNGLNDLVLGIHEARDGTMWAGSDYDGGLFQMKSNVWTRFGRDRGMMDNALRVIHEDRSGDIWVGSTTGLEKWREEAVTRFTITNGLPGNTVRAITEAPNGDLWFGTSGGLSLYHEGSFRNFTMQDGLSANAVLALWLDAQGDLWIGTEAGLNRRHEGKFTSYARKQGLFSDTVFEIVEDDFGNLWMSCFSGVFRVNKKNIDEFDHGQARNLNCVSYGRDDGMASVQCNGIAKPGGWKSKDGRIWFPTTRGVAVVDPKIALGMKRVQPPIFIEEITADKMLHFHFKDEKRPAAIVLQPGTRELEFQFSALSFREPEKNRFKYKLEGADSDWVDSGNRPAAYYNSLRPGKYRFHVIGCSSDSVWNETGDSIAIEILPHFWQTWWFTTVAILLSVGFVGGTARFLTHRRMQRHLQILEQQAAIERERSRIARDIHDELGARLTQISFLGSVAKRQLSKPPEAEAQIDKISETALEMVSALDEIVWAVDPRNDTLDGLATYLCRYASEFFSSSAVLCRFDFPSELPSIRLETDVRHNLFLAVKEALNNALKHSGATEVSLKIALHVDAFELVVSDNGKGFVRETQPAAPPASKSKRVGNGVGNMHQRLEAIGGSCVLKSEVGKGTVISYKVFFQRKEA